MLPRERKAAKGTTKEMATATATNSDSMARYQTMDLRDIDPESHLSHRIGGGGRRGEEDEEVHSQGNEVTTNLELGRFLAELEDQEGNKNEDDGDIGLIGEEKRRDEDEEKSGCSGDGRRRTDQGGGQGPNPVD